MFPKSRRRRVTVTVAPMPRTYGAVKLLVHVCNVARASHNETWIREGVGEEKRSRVPVTLEAALKQEEASF